jgi:hypothetical protein
MLPQRSLLSFILLCFFPSSSVFFLYVKKTPQQYSYFSFIEKKKIRGEEEVQRREESRFHFGSLWRTMAPETWLAQPVQSTQPSAVQAPLICLLL